MKVIFFAFLLIQAASLNFSSVGYAKNPCTDDYNKYCEGTEGKPKQRRTCVKEKILDRPGVLKTLSAECQQFRAEMKDLRQDCSDEIAKYCSVKDRKPGENLIQCLDRRLPEKSDDDCEKDVRQALNLIKKANQGAR